MTVAEEVEDTGDIAEAVTRFGRRARRIVPLHSPSGPVRERASYRIEIAPGIAFKARRFESEAAALQQRQLRTDLPAAFAPVLAQIGAILLETWIDGRPLSEAAPQEEMIRQAGEILAALHALTGAGGRALPFRAPIAELRGEVVAGLRWLADAGALDPATVATLDDIVARGPHESRHCLIHTDFCAENLIVDAAGRLFVIDNEHFRFGPPSMDLARSWYRWGWHDSSRPAEEWRWFRQAYGTAGGDPEAFRHSPFWRVAAVVMSALLRLRTRYPDAATPLTVLHGLAQSAETGGSS